jgi:hypothetical protein
MFTTREQRLIVTMLADGSPVWYVAAVTKKDRHSTYLVGVQHGYPHRGALKRALEELTVSADAMAATG